MSSFSKSETIISLTLIAYVFTILGTHIALDYNKTITAMENGYTQNDRGHWVKTIKDK